MTRFIPWPAFLAAGLCLVGPAPAGEKQEKQVQVKKESTAAPQDQGGDKLTRQQFVSRALDISLSETDMAQKAAAGASADKVKQFARQLVDDHKKLNRQLTDLADTLKLGVVAGLGAEHKKAMARMLLARGNDFDREFLTYAVRSHEKAVKLFEQAARDGGPEGDARIRDVAKESLPPLRRHLDDARALQSMMFGTGGEKR
jgi:putative membrane protein